MSHDQRPARIKVVAGGTAPRRRIADPMDDLEFGEPAPPAVVAPPQAAARKIGWAALSVLFLLGCAVGGIAGGALPLLRMLGT